MSDFTKLRIGLIALARPTFDTALAAEMAAAGRAQLAATGCTLLGPQALIMSLEEAATAAQALAGQDLHLLVLLQASFADSTMTLALAKTVDAPLLLWAVPEERVGGRLRLNSLCGINLGGHALRRAGFRYDTIYAPPDDPAALAKIGPLAQAGRVRRLLAGTRIGVVGEHPAGFDSCGYDAANLRRRLGVDILPIALDSAFADMRAVGPERTQPVRARLAPRLAGLEAVDQQALQGTLGVYVALAERVKTSGLSGLAVRCWPEFFTQLGCAACGAMSMLSDEGTPCGCEADVNGTITQFMLQALSDEPAFGADLVAVDPERDAVILWHCGLAPLAMADPAATPRATIHSNRRLPLLMEFPLKPGRVTAARLSEATGELRLVIGTGEMVQAPPAFTGTTGALRFDRPAVEILDILLGEGLEHHISLTYGDHAPALLALARLLDLPVLQL